MTQALLAAWSPLDSPLGLSSMSRTRGGRFPPHPIIHCSAIGSTQPDVAFSRPNFVTEFIQGTIKRYETSTGLVNRAMFKEVGPRPAM